MSDAAARRAPSPAPLRAPVARHRRGAPSPLIFHLAVGLAAYQQALLAAPRAGDPRFPWAPHLRAAAAEMLAETHGRAASGPTGSPTGSPPGGPLDRPPERIAIAREIGARLAATLRGLETWQRHPYRRRMTEPPAIWRAGASRLLDYGRAPEATAPDGPPVLVVPSLINRAYILDLMPERSLLRWLAAEGLRPVLLDWGPPGPEERGLDLEGYGAERLLPALRALRRDAGRPVAVLGYCMGGTLAAGLAARIETGIAALAVIGAPWSFAASAGIAGGLRTMLRAEGAGPFADHLDALGEAYGAIPVSLFQALFALVNPMQATLKFQRLAALDPAGPAARLFVALEDWLADGVPMARGAARDLLVDWQIGNAPDRGAWRFLGAPVRPGAIGVPMLAFCGQADTIAPPAMALPLPRAVPGARIATPATGHVGMIAGSLARPQVWRPLAAFLREHAA